jgi:hypothetical protein
MVTRSDGDADSASAHDEPTAAPTGAAATDASADSPNTAQLRARIPSARTVTIDSAHEPAAASFDTDDEAAGRPPPAAAIRQALAHERGVPPQRQARDDGSRGVYWVIVALLALAALTATLVAAT